MSRKIHQREGSAKLTPENVGAGDFGRLRRQTRSESQGHVKDKMNAIACCYTIACALERDEVQRKKFMRNPFFKDMTRKPEQDDLSQWVLLYIFRAKRAGPARDRARRYGAILRRYKREGVHPTQALSQLEEDNGIAGAYKKCSVDRCASKRNVAENEESSQLKSDLEGAQDDSRDGQDESSPSGQRQCLLACHERSFLRVECTQEQMFSVLALSTARLTVEISPEPRVSDSEWKLVSLSSFEEQSS